MDSGRAANRRVIRRTPWMNASIVCVGGYIGLKKIDDGIWNVYFGPFKLGRLHERHLRIEDE